MFCLHLLRFITSSSKLTACEKCGEVEQTLALLADLKKQEDIVPDSYICNIAMIACSKAVSASILLRSISWSRRLAGNRDVTSRVLLPPDCSHTTPRGRPVNILLLIAKY